MVIQIRGINGSLEACVFPDLRMFPIYNMRRFRNFVNATTQNSEEFRSVIC
jgi:hypothetical protein